MKSNLNELLLVLEKLRAERHPEIPAEVIESIAILQRDNQESIDIRQGKMKNYFDQITKGIGEEL